MKFNQTKRKAFTIVELLISIMIIGILAGLGYGQYTKAVDSAKAKGLISLLNKVNAAASDYFRTYGQYPESFANNQFLKMVKEMEIQTTGVATEGNINLKVLANLGPRTTMDLKYDFDYQDGASGGAIGTSSGKAAFRYIVVRNVPSKIASDVARDINGVNNTGTGNTVSCQLDTKNWKVAITNAGNLTPMQQHTESQAQDTNKPSGTNASCIPYEKLIDASSGINNVDLWYTFSRTTDIQDNW